VILSPSLPVSILDAVYWTDNEDTVDISGSEYCTAMQEISKAGISNSPIGCLCHGSLDKSCGRKKIGFFFRGKTNKHNRSKSLKKKFAAPQKDSKEYKPSSKSTNVGRTKQQISPAIIESVDGGYLDSLLNSGWSGEDIGQKLLILRVPNTDCSLNQPAAGFLHKAYISIRGRCPFHERGARGKKPSA